MEQIAGRLLGVFTGLSLLVLLVLTGFFSFGEFIPVTTDINPGLIDHLLFRLPATGVFLTHYWLGFGHTAAGLDPLSIMAHLPTWVLFCGHYPLFTALCIPAAYWMLRELDLRRSTAIFGGVVYAWQGDIFSTLLAGHLPAPILWCAFPVAAACAMRSARLQSWLWAAWCGTATGLMVAMLADRGAIASLLIAGLFAVEVWRSYFKHGPVAALHVLGRLLVTVAVAGFIALPGLSQVFNVAIGEDIQKPGVENREASFNWATQWSFAPEDTLSYFAPGVLGWHSGSREGPYWGRIGREAEWSPIAPNRGMRNFNLAISSIGTLGSLLAVGALPLFLLRFRRADGEPLFDGRQLVYGGFFLVAAVLALIFSFGKHTPLYNLIFDLPLMDSWRNPLKFLIVTNLGLTVAAAYAAEALAHGLEQTGPRPAIFAWLDRYPLYICAGLVVMGLPLLAFAFVPIAGSLERYGYSMDTNGRIFFTTLTAYFVACTVLSTSAAAWYLLCRPERFRGVSFVNPLIQRLWDFAFRDGNRGAALLMVFSGLTFLQMLWVHSHFVVLDNFGERYGSNPLVQQLLKPEDEPHRSKFHIEMDPEHPYPEQAYLRHLLQSTFPYNGISSVDIPAASRIPNDYARFFGALSLNQPRLHDLAGVRYFVGPAKFVDILKGDKDFQRNNVRILYFGAPGGTRFDAPNISVAELGAYLKKMTFIPFFETTSSPESLEGRLFVADWDVRKSVLFSVTEGKRLVGLHPELAERNIANQDASANGFSARINLKTYNPTLIEADVDASAAGFVLINDRFDPAWSAMLNGKPVEIFRGNLLMRVIPVPAGTSRLVLHYHSGSWVVYLQLLTWATLVGASVYFWVWRPSSRG